MTTREWLEELTGHVRGGHVVRNDDAARLLDLLQRMQADVQGNWEAWQAALARADTAEAALAARDTPCVWAPEKDVWGDDYADDGFRTQCGAWYLSRAIKDGHFCPNCGHPVEVAP